MYFLIRTESCSDMPFFVIGMWDSAAEVDYMKNVLDSENTNPLVSYVISKVITDGEA